MCQSIILYFENFLSQFLGGLLMCECFHAMCGLKKKRTKLMKLYQVGHDRYEKEVDVIRLIKNLKAMRILLKGEFLGDPLKLL